MNIKESSEDIPYFPDPEEVPRVSDDVLPEPEYVITSREVRFPVELIHNWSHNNITTGWDEALKAVEAFSKRIRNYR